MLEAERLLERSMYYPSCEEIRRHNSFNPDYYPINSREFSFSRERLFLASSVREVLPHIREQTAKEKVEYTIVLYGKKVENAIIMTEYCFARGSKHGANYTDLQKTRARNTMLESDGRVVYGHSHTSAEKKHNCFSLTDLRYIISVALATQKDAYGFLITKECAYAIKYDFNIKEFFQMKWE